MSVRTYPKPDLELPRDNQLIDHVLRNHITTLSVVQDLFFAGLNYDTARKVLRRLVAANYLTRYPLFANGDYFRLGKAAISRWGYPRTRVPALGAQRLPYELGSLAYCCMDSDSDTGKKRTRLHASEILAQASWFPEPLTQWAYLIKGDVLYSIRVEINHFGPSILQKLGQQLYEYSVLSQFKKCIQEKRFGFVVVMASEQQETALKKALRDEPFPVHVITEHYTELARFI